jgi:pilus assembly protein CpaB
MRLLLALVLLVAAAGLGFVAWRAVEPPRAEAVQSSRTVRLLVAARPLAPGTLLKDGDVKSEEVPVARADDTMLRDEPDDRAELRGALLRRYLEVGGRMLRDDVLRPRDRGFLAAVLRPGTRAISIGVDAVTGAAGLIWPGDQVDLILTQQLDAAQAPVAQRIVAETVLTDVRVIAVDQQIAQGAGSSESATRNVARTVTLEVSGLQAERVAVAGRLGRLSLTVRAMEPESGAAAPALASGGISGADVSAALSRVRQTGTRMRVIQGNESQEMSFQ